MPKILTAEELYKCCDQNVFKFNTTEEIPETIEIIGQARALRAIDFGLNLVDSKGFNIFVLGENGTGKLTTIKSVLAEKASGEPVPPDCAMYTISKILISSRDITAARSSCYFP